MEKARRRERSDTPFATSSSAEKKYGIILGPNTKHKIENNSPTKREMQRMTFMENFATLAFPLANPSDTRTLHMHITKVDY